MTKPTITTRAGKGSALTWTEGDTNLTNLRDATLTVKAGTGGTDVVSDLNGTVTLVAGTNVTLSGDNTAKTVTINASGGSTSPAGSNTQVQFNDGGAFGASSSLTWTGTSLNAPILASTQSSGDEGGQVELAIAATNTTLSGTVAIDINQNRLRIFETGGSNRGAYIDLSAASTSVGTNLLAGGGGMTSFTAAGDTGASQTVDNGATLTIAGGTGLSSVASATDTITLNLDNTSVTAGSYTYSSITVDAQGRITSASNGTAPSTVTVSDDTTTNATRYLVFEDVTSGTSTSINVSSTKLTFNPSSGTLTATAFSGPHNGTVGATTPESGAFTTLTANTSATLKGVTEGTIYGLGVTGGTIAPNVANGNVQNIVLNSALTINGFTSPVAGQTLTLIIYGGTAYTSITSTMKFAGGVKTLTGTANCIDILSVYYDGTTYFASLGKGFA